MLPERQQFDLSHAPPHSARELPRAADDERLRAPCQEPPPGTLRPVDGPVRTFCDREGVHWRAYVATGEGETRPSLVFESADAVRRIQRYPAGWLALSERDLECLSRAQ